MKHILLGLISFLLAFPVIAEEFSFNILAQDEAVVKEVRSEGENVWIKLAPNYLKDSITLRISNQNKDFYRIWFNNEKDLVSSGHRGRNVWTDRVQTGAMYIEYWHNDILVLQLERKN
jgi:hypothetical protein